MASADPRHNRWFRAMERHESAANGVSLWTFHVIGSLLVVTAMILAMVSILHVTGDMGSGSADRLRGIVWLVGAAALFLVGRRLADDYRIHPRSRS